MEHLLKEIDTLLFKTCIFGKNLALTSAVGRQIDFSNAYNVMICGTWEAAESNVFEHVLRMGDSRRKEKIFYVAELNL